MAHHSYHSLACPEATRIPLPRFRTLAYTMVMPAKNSVRQYEEGGIYHIYNRGINKQDIFLDKKDYAMFLFYLKLYLEKPENVKDIDFQKRNYLERKNFYKNVDLLLYCLMPNHLHLSIKQEGEKDITSLMRCLMLNYSMYFNKRHNRVGPLFQGRYKAVLVQNDEYLVHLSRYIHLNPSAKVPNLGEYDYSSYNAYLGNQNVDWLNTDLILDYFANQGEDRSGAIKSYKDFVENSKKVDSEKIIGPLALDNK